MNRKLLIAILITLFAAGGILYIMSSRETDVIPPPVTAPRETESPTTTPEKPEEPAQVEATEKERFDHFHRQMIVLGVAAVGQPIEGFDASLFMQAFPGLVEADFEGVATFEGEYEMKDGKLVWVRTDEGIASSAEMTLSEQGFLTLYTNIQARLGVTLESKADVDAMIATLQKK